MTVPRSAKAARITRVPVTERNVLSVKGKEPGFHYRIVNDTGDRVQQLIDAGYEIVEASSVQIGDKRIASVAPEGSKAQVSLGGGVKGFVMRQKPQSKHALTNKKNQLNKFPALLVQ
jgi:hypothetical protein